MVVLNKIEQKRGLPADGEDPIGNKFPKLRKKSEARLKGLSYSVTTQFRQINSTLKVNTYMYGVLFRVKKERDEIKNDLSESITDVSFTTNPFAVFLQAGGRFYSKPTSSDEWQLFSQATAFQRCIAPLNGLQLAAFCFCFFISKRLGDNDLSVRIGVWGTLFAV